ncbi:MAG: CHASE domain-containing protein [Holophaga sp.]|nr:CHASE domain-containing protein [Holophaga sp.]
MGLGARGKSFIPRFSLATGILLVGSLTTVGVFLVTRSIQKQRAQERFVESLNSAHGHLQERLRVCDDLLRGVRGLLQSEGQVNRSSFRRFLQAMDLERRYPGLLGVAYGIPLAGLGPEAIEKRLRSEHGRPDLRIHPGVGFGDDAVILYEEPEEPNRRALGFNSCSSPAQRESLVAARDSGELRASAPMTLAQAPQGGPGLVLRLAVYSGSEIPGTVEARRQSFIGYANAIFLMRQLAESAIANLHVDGVQIQAVDITEPAKPIPFLEGGGALPWREWHRFGPRVLKENRYLDIGGRRWELRFTASKSFFLAGEVGLPWLLALASFQTTLLLAGLVRSMSRTGKKARELADRMTAEFLRTESRLKAISKVLPDLVLVLDRDGRYLEVLTQDINALAAPAEVLVGRTVQEVLPSELAIQALQMIGKTLDTGTTQSLEYSLKVPRGLVQFEALISPMDSGLEGLPCVIWVARDVTERRLQEEAFRQTQKLEGLGLLAGGIAHDFNNLLAAIQGNLSLGRLTLQDGQDPSRYLELAEGSVRRAADLARQLLAYSGNAQFQVEPLNLNVLVEEMTSLLSVSRSKKVLLHLDLAPELPIILGDRVQLQQVVMNLVTNASEAMAQSVGTIGIRTSTIHLDACTLAVKLPGQDLDPGDFVVVEVKDEGCGMSPEVLSRIFDPFFTTKPTGRGLGLSALRGILRAHRAGIEVHSQVGSGTRIVIYLPLDTSLGNQAPEISVAEKAPTRFLGTILVAEDEIVIRETTRAMAERLGFVVLEAADGEEALNHFRAQGDRLSVVMLDLTMPRLGGIEVYSEIRRINPTIPIILCSGYSREAIPPMESPDEPRAFLQKPFSFSQLRTALEDVSRRAKTT